MPGAAAQIRRPSIPTSQRLQFVLNGVSIYTGPFCSLMEYDGVLLIVLLSSGIGVRRTSQNNSDELYRTQFIYKYSDILSRNTSRYDEQLIQNDPMSRNSRIISDCADRV